MNQSSQLQIRVSPLEKKSIRQAAKQAGLGMSEYVLSRLFPQQSVVFSKLVKKLEVAKDPAFILAEIHDLLVKMNSSEFADAFTENSLRQLTPYLQNYIAAMIEQAALQKKADIPPWLKDIKILKDPVFGSHLKSLRLHLLTNSPIPFRKRNIFIDSTLGDRI